MKILFTDATSNFSPDRISKKPTGGILNSLTIIPQFLASKGHEVYVSCDCKKKIVTKGVTYLPLDWTEKIPKWDVIVINRNGLNNQIVGYSKSIGAKVVWWLHDIVDFRYLQDSSYQHVDKIIALSNYCKKSFSEFYDIPKEKFVVIPNGVDKKMFYPGDYKKRKKYRIVMASALIKGVLPVEQTWNNIKRQFPDSELYIYSSQTLHDKENNKEQNGFLSGMESLGARVMQPVRQEVLAEIMRTSWILLMPNTYPEICSNVLLQAQACGLPVVSSNIGANPEFIRHNETGVITEDYPHDIWLWVKKYVEATVNLCKDDDLHYQISKNAPEGILDWNEIGERWEKCLKD
jgi:glycosyltransferase involved in cell wall biosynthesis